jgi:hypothetical protein
MVSLELCIENIGKALQFCCSLPGSHLFFTGEASLAVNGINIFEAKRKKEEEVASWLLWFLREQKNYCDPSTYKSDAPEKVLVQRYGLGNELAEWADHHVLMHDMEEAPYLTLQAPSSDELEICWNFNSPYVHRKGRVIVPAADFIKEVEKEKKRIYSMLSGIPQLKDSCWLKELQ